MTQITESSFILDSSRIALYYNKFKYRARLEISKIGLFRGVVDKLQIPQRLERLKAAYYYHYNDSSDSVEIQQLVSWLENNQDKSNEFIVRYQNDAVDVYSNNVALIQSLLSEVQTEKYLLFYSEMMAGYKCGQLYLKNSESKYRAYFKWTKITEDTRKSLNEFVAVYKIKPSKSFANWLLSDTRQPISNWLLSGYTWYLRDNYFFDFEDEMIITLVSLKYDNIIRRVCKIEKR